ncbi:histidine kinase [Niabella sp. W65]|nr:histidine kinase [Niabella sp. W65]MCH7363653.1 histidine kinase [Niabella sp. W65]ULT39566.1 histidine kinase [Niabella sp. I65]
MADSAGTKYDKYESMHALSSILYAQGNIIDAERVKDQMNELENEIRGDELQQKTILIEKKFETGKKEAQIKLQQAQLQQKNTLNYLLGGTAFSAILIGFFGYRNYQHRQKLQQAKIDELETEKQLTVTEAVLKGEEQERTRLAKDLHDGLGGMLSGIKHSLSNIKENLIVTPDNMQAFERSIDMLDGSIREMRRVAHNMMPEILLKYGLDTALKEFCAEVDLSGALHVQYQSIGLANSTIDQTISVTIYRVVQELVNNVIKHAAAKMCWYRCICQSS